MFYKITIVFETDNFVIKFYHNGCIGMHVCVLLLSVSSLMSYKIVLRIESLVTLAALVRLVSGVILLVYYTMTSQWEGLITIAALKWLLPSVCSHMGVYVAIL